MATAFADLHPFMRALLGDHDAQVRLFSDDVLNSHIRLRLLSTPDIQESGSTAQFTTDLTPTQKAILIYQSCKSVIAHMPNKFSFRTPVHAGSREGGIAQLMAYIDSQLAELDGGVLVLRYDTELTAILNGADRFYDNWTAAQNESQ
jgi:hypothetical protein